jgi:hypothetical protein
MEPMLEPWKLLEIERSWLIGREPAGLFPAPPEAVMGFEVDGRGWLPP